MFLSLPSSLPFPQLYPAQLFHPPLSRGLSILSIAGDLRTIQGLCAKVRSSEDRHVCYRINILDSQLSSSSNAQAGKVFLVSHWPCVTDTVVYPPTGSTAKDREMSTHAYAPSGRGTIHL